MIKAKNSNNEYVNIEDIKCVKLGETKDIEYIKDNIGNVLYSKYKEIETEILPTNFISKDNKLKNYRIYGNTVNGESVGEKMVNCFDKNDLTQIFGPGYNLPDNDSIWRKYEGVAYTIRIPCEPNTTYTLTIERETTLFRLATVSTNNIPVQFDSSVKCTKVIYTTSVIKKYTFKTSNDAKFILFQPSVNDLEMVINSLVVTESSTEVDYEQYQYKIPLTVNEKTINIYLHEPLSKSGDIADYIDFKEQKRFNANSTSEDVTLPEITVTTGTNTLSVGTVVQPSKVYLKGKIKEINY